MSSWGVLNERQQQYMQFSVIDQCKQTNPTDKVALQSSNNG